MKSIYLYLNGGLGNQMFQYATARALALRNGAELVLDTWSGFARDYQYGRTYELDCLPIQGREATKLERIPIWFFRAENKFRKLSEILVQHRFYGNFVVENELEFIEEVRSCRNDKDIWLSGYWQSPRYFDECSAELHEELMPPRPNSRKFLDIGQRLRDTESVALGIRLYEESLDPTAHAKDGLVKGVSDLNVAIDRLLRLQPNATFYLFCTHRSPILSKLNLPDNTVYLTHDDGYEGTIQRLWLLAQCKHHIFTNSSFYWWGAWLSQLSYSPSSVSQHIFAADNFINRDGLCDTWEKF